jgi:hypothetical protein
MSVQLPNLMTTKFGNYFNYENRKYLGYGSKISKVYCGAAAFFRDTEGEYMELLTLEKLI